MLDSFYFFKRLVWTDRNFLSGHEEKVAGTTDRKSLSGHEEKVAGPELKARHEGLICDGAVVPDRAGAGPIRHTPATSAGNGVTPTHWTLQAPMSNA